MSLPPEMEAMEERARELYAQVQDPRIPERFRKPEDFGFTSSQKRLAESGSTGNPAGPDATDASEASRRRAALMYRTTNEDYGRFDPSILEMPAQWNGKRDDMVRMQNYTVYRSDGLNTALDKGRYID